MSDEIILLSEYARRKGVHVQTIKDKIKAGTITKEALVVSSSGQIRGVIVAKAEKDLAERSDLQNSMTAQFKKKKKKNMETKTPDPVVVNPVAKPVTTLEKVEGQEDPVPVTKLPEGNDDFSRYQKAKASSEELKARKLEIEMQELEGRLIDKEEVRKTIFKLVGETKEAFLNIPARVAPDLLASKDIVDVEMRLLKEINDVLASLSRIEKRYE